MFGTRPEAIKMCPIILATKKYNNFSVTICTTGQHLELLDDVLTLFGLEADYKFQLMEHGQSLTSLTHRIMKELENVVKIVKPDLLFVHGDTTTALTASLVGFYNKIQIAHVEAGLRSFNLDAPWPEEFNRKTISSMAKLHFAPTQENATNLVSEGISEDRIFVTGNTVVDALQIIEHKHTFIPHDINFYEKKCAILVTLHRRESFPVGIENVCRAVKELAETYKEVCILFPMHPNQKVREIIKTHLSNNIAVKLCEPLRYDSFLRAMRLSRFIITDSGGIQEEAAAMGKPVLIARSVTERMELVRAGGAKLVSDDVSKIVKEAVKLILNDAEHTRMSKAGSIFGDGNASERIIEQVEKINV